MDVFLFIILCVLSLSIVIYQVVIDAIWKKQPIQNFKFTWKGKDFWYSRSCAITNLVLAKNANDEWCVLANKRGRGTPDYNGYWNLICGYLDFHESGEECAKRETFEESGLDIPLEKIKFHNVNTSPSSNKQNVVVRYLTILDDVKCEDLTTTTSYSEKDEVDEIKWIPLNEINDYQWAFDHQELITFMTEGIL